MLNPAHSKEFFNSYREPVNFLKHADTDHDGLLPFYDIVRLTDFAILSTIVRLPRMASNLLVTRSDWLIGKMTFLEVRVGSKGEIHVFRVAPHSGHWVGHVTRCSVAMCKGRTLLAQDSKFSDSSSCHRRTASRQKRPVARGCLRQGTVISSSKKFGSDFAKRT